MIDCASAHLASDAADACLSYAATVRAADIAAEATRQAACISLGAALTALIGAGLVLLNGARDRRQVRNIHAEDARQNVRRMAAVYRAELSSLWVFLNDHDVIGTLNRAALAATPWDFTPGELWLATYNRDPSTARWFNPELAEAIASCFPRTLNELGRLRWLHKWRPEPFDPTALKRQLDMTAGTLSQLQGEAEHIKLLLTQVTS